MSYQLFEGKKNMSKETESCLGVIFAWFMMLALMFGGGVILWAVLRSFGVYVEYMASVGSLAVAWIIGVLVRPRKDTK